MITYFFRADDTFAWKKIKYGRGYYRTSNVDFIREAQGFVTVVSEVPKGQSFFDFDAHKMVDGAEEIEIETSDETITLNINDPKNIKVDIEKNEPISLEEMQEEISKIEKKEIDELLDGPLIKPSPEDIVDDKELDIDLDELEDELQKFSETITDSDDDESLQNSIPKN